MSLNPTSDYLLRAGMALDAVRQREDDALRNDIDAAISEATLCKEKLAQQYKRAAVLSMRHDALLALTRRRYLELLRTRKERTSGVVNDPEAEAIIKRYPWPMSAQKEANDD